MKYELLKKDIFDLIAKVSWGDVKVYPADMVIESSHSPFVRITIVPSGYAVNNNSASGIISADIFVESGRGPSKLFQLASFIDRHFSKKTITSAPGRSLQLRNSSFSPMGVDSADPGLLRGNLIIPFTFYGVS